MKAYNTQTNFPEPDSPVGFSYSECLAASDRVATVNQALQFKTIPKRKSYKQAIITKNLFVPLEKDLVATESEFHALKQVQFGKKGKNITQSSKQLKRALAVIRILENSKLEKSGWVMVSTDIFANLLKAGNRHVTETLTLLLDAGFIQRIKFASTSGKLAYKYKTTQEWNERKATYVIQKAIDRMKDRKKPTTSPQTPLESPTIDPKQILELDSIPSGKSIRIDPDPLWHCFKCNSQFRQSICALVDASDDPDCFETLVACPFCWANNLDEFDSIDLLESK